MLKSLKNRPYGKFAWLLYNQTVFQKIERNFIDQVVIDAKMCKSIYEHLLKKATFKFFKDSRAVK